MTLAIKLFFSLPLALIHLLGCLLGLLMYLFDFKFRDRIIKNIQRTNIKKTDVEIKKLVISNSMHIGMTLMESFSIWFASSKKIDSWVKKTSNWSLINKKQSKDKGVIFLTPHLGSFEITAQYYGARHPIKVMYKPSKNKWLDNIIFKGRSKNLVSPVSIELSGMKQILQALKKGEAVGILPDQVPPEGHGEWSSFFNQKVYTMTLIQKLHKLTGAPIIFAFGKREGIGKGFSVNLYEFKGDPTPKKIDQFIEELVKSSPEQYLWNYRRYKLPKL